MNAMYPPRLIKTLSQDSHAADFSKGTVILRCLSYFRMCEGSRGDKNESTVEYVDSNNIHRITTDVTPTLILSLWMPSSSWEGECNKFGSHHVEIIDPCALFLMIQKRLQDILFKDNNAYFSKVDYMNYGEDIENPKDKQGSFEKARKSNFFCNEVYVKEIDPLQNGLGIQCNFIKDKRFQKEKEARMVFLFKPTYIKEILNQRGDTQIKLWKKETEYDISKEPICTINKTCQLFDYDIWRKDRFNHNGSYHWVEVILENLPVNHFKRLS